MKVVGRIKGHPIVIDPDLENTLTRYLIGLLYVDGGILLIKRADDGSIEIITTEE